MNNGDTARVEMRRARSFLEYADDDLARTHWARAMSSSYHAAFHAAKAVLAMSGDDTVTKSHSGVQRMFSLHAVRDSDFPPEAAKALGRLQSAYLTADYDAVEWESFTRQDAERATARAGVFVEEADRWLKGRVEESKMT